MPLHFSALKRMALSPAHLRAAEAEQLETTRAMRIGTIVHRIVCGPHKARRLVRWEGERRGVDWKRFEADQPPKTEIVTAPEWAEAAPIADAVMSHHMASTLLANTRREVDLRWSHHGVDCETDGVDFVGTDYFGDLKTTTCTEPVAFSRHSFKLLYHAQLAWLRSALLAQDETLAKAAENAFLLGVETSPPYAVTILRMTPESLHLGDQSVTLWLDRYRQCAASNHWPAYTQCIEEFQVPAWVGGEDE